MKIKIKDFGLVMKTRSSDTESLFFRDAWVFQNDVDKTSNQMLKEAEKHFKDLLKISQKTLQTIEGFLP